MPFARNYKKRLLEAGLDSLKTASKNVVYKTGEFLGTKIADAITDSYDDKTMKTKPVKEMIIPPEKKRKYETN